MNKTLAAVGFAVALAACQQQVAEPAAVALTEAEATKIAEASQAAFTSMDVGKIDAVYADSVIAFDLGEPAIISGSEGMHKVNAAFAAMKFDSATVADRKIQVLDADTFIDTATANLTSTDGEVKAFALRFSNVYQKQADGSWKVVHEHLSVPPKS